MWKEGSLRVHDSLYHYWMKVYDSIFHYWVKHYEEGSQYGIEGGRISKMMLKRNGKIVLNYDRGWDVKPTDPDTQLAVEILLHSDNY